MNEVRPIGVLVVLRCRPDASPLGPPAALLERALTAGARAAAGAAPTALDATLTDVDAVLRSALAYTGAAPHLDPGKHATLESTARGWRLVALGVHDPVHGLGGDEGIGPPTAAEVP
ncbi:hypothetical protein Pla163_14670 [Planctomycetes bacterium Pla163]|uniref:Uncharacterized protein n=1 Tax=Rohdeia mirabilis TaxID=2528008 RepID=A0A518CYP6_9BACT|nr:hypothetical protein Pla163_14670 [Planctomycetes bacterium Pla163]